LDTVGFGRIQWDSVGFGCIRWDSVVFGWIPSYFLGFGGIGGILWVKKNMLLPARTVSWLPLRNGGRAFKRRVQSKKAFFSTLPLFCDILPDWIVCCLAVCNSRAASSGWDSGRASMAFGYSGGVLKNAFFDCNRRLKALPPLRRGSQETVRAGRSMFFFTHRIPPMPPNPKKYDGIQPNTTESHRIQPNPTESH
jgi:hypothetical protein